MGLFQSILFYFFYPQTFTTYKLEYDQSFFSEEKKLMDNTKFDGTKEDSPLSIIIYFFGDMSSGFHQISSVSGGIFYTVLCFSVIRIRFFAVLPQNS